MACAWPGRLSFKLAGSSWLDLYGMTWLLRASILGTPFRPDRFRRKRLIERRLQTFSHARRPDRDQTCHRFVRRPSSIRNRTFIAASRDCRLRTLALNPGVGLGVRRVARLVAVIHCAWSCA